MSSFSSGSIMCLRQFRVWERLPRGPFRKDILKNHYDDPMHGVTVSHIIIHLRDDKVYFTCFQEAFRNTREAFVPPKPKELDSAIAISLWRDL